MLTICTAAFGCLIALAAAQVPVVDGARPAVTAVSTSISTARVEVCSTHYVDECNCPVPTVASTIFVPKSVTLTRLLTDAAAVTPAPAPTRTTTLIVTVTTGVVPRNNEVIPLNPSEDALVPEPAPAECVANQPCNWDDPHPKNVVCYHISASPPSAMLLRSSSS